MLRLISVLTLLFFAIANISCGGSGSNVTPKPVGKTTSVTIPPASPVDTSFEDVGLKAKPTAFPSGCDLTITTYETAKDRPPSPTLYQASSQVEIAPSVIPDSDLEISFSGADTTKEIVTFQQSSSGWAMVPHTVVNGKVVCTLDRTKTVSVDTSRSIVSGYRAFVGWVSIILPEKMSLKKVSGDGTLGPNTCIAIHGIFDTHNDTTILAEALAYNSECTNVYSVAYDWRLPASKVAEFLAQEIEKLEKRGDCDRELVLVAHSRGVNVARYLLEKLHKGRVFRDAFFICGPNWGSTRATGYDFWLDMINQIANSTRSVEYPLLAHTFIDELTAFSNFCMNLNTPSGAKSSVNYVFVAASNDDLVNQDSALANNVAFDRITSGRVDRFVIKGTHGGVKTEDAQIWAIVRAIWPED